MAALAGPRSPLAGVSLLRRLDADPYGTLADLHARWGDVVSVRAGPVRMVFVFGADANEAVLADAADALAWRPAMKMLEPVDGPTALVVTDGPEHDRRRRMVQPAFAVRRIEAHLPVALAEVDRAIDELEVGATVDLHAWARRTIRRTVVLALFGEHLRARADEIGDLLQPAFDFLMLPPLEQQRRVPLPGTRYQRARRARRAVDAVIDAEVARRRAGVHGSHDDSADAASDVLSMLLAARDERGAALTDAEVRDQVVSLVAAGYDTTSAAVAWTVQLLLDHPDEWEALRSELDASVRDRPLDAATLRGLGRLDGVVRESLRLRPPGAMAGRGAVGPLEVLGRRIPKRSLVFYSASVTGRDPRSWRDPERFDPDRWDSAAPHHVEPHPYAFVPFGGGARRCLGFALATLDVKVAVAQLVRRTQLAPAWSGRVVARGLATVVPSGGLPVRVEGVDSTPAG